MRNKTKRKILCDLGSNWTLEQKKLEISAYKWLLPIKKNHISLNTKIARLELAKTPIKKGRNELLDSLRPVLRRGRDSKTEVESLKNLKNTCKIDENPYKN